MERKQTIEFMERIKQHYQEFIIDEYKLNEWHNILKDYEYEDVNKKLDEHLRSEQNGQYVPKVMFLTKYLTKIGEKQTASNFIVTCPLCMKAINYANFTKHYDRCSSTNFLIENSIKYFNKNLNYQKLMEAEEEQFETYYYNFCKELVDKVQNEDLKRGLQSYLNSASKYYDNR